MRAVTQKEQRGRGCVYCAHAKEMSKAKDAVRPDDAKKGEHCLACPWEKCPYHELDGIKNYVTEYDRKIAERMPYLRLGGE